MEKVNWYQGTFLEVKGVHKFDEKSVKRGKKWPGFHSFVGFINFKL